MNNKTRQPPGTSSRQPLQYGDWARYEILKAQYTAKASNAAEYDAAVRRAAKEAEV